MNNRIFKTIGVAACFWAVLVLCGGHWFALQSFAWVRMTIEYSRQESLTSAVRKTFDGRHPCPLCLKVQQGWQRQQQRQHQAPSLNAESLSEAVWEWRSLTAPAMPVFPVGASAIAPSTYSGLSASPPKPPPRG